MLAALDWLITALHVLVVLAFCFLWIPQSTARLHGWLVAIVAASWLGLGVVLSKGIGYCFLTDLGWRVKRARGETHLPGSFLKYLADHVTGSDVPARLVDGTAAALFVFGCGAAVFRLVQSKRR